MPYIPQERREKFDQLLKSFRELGILEAGEINYVISNMFNIQCLENTFNYGLLNSFIGVLECIKLELYRRIVSPYEDKKIKENGDVYSIN